MKTDRTNRIEIEEKPEEKEQTKKKKGEKSKKTTAKKTTSTKNKLLCPLCKKGTLLKGKSAFGCSEWQKGCAFRLSFDGKVENMNDDELSAFLSSQSE